MPNTPDLLDQAILTELRDIGDAEFLVDLFSTYLEDADQKIASMAEALDSQDAQTFGMLAHTLKGSSSNIGAKRVAHLASQLQDMGYNDELSHAQTVLTELQADFEQVRQALTTEMAQS